MRAAVNSRSLIYKIVMEMTELYQILSSKETRAELQDVLYRPHLRKKFVELTDEIAEKFIALLINEEDIELTYPIPQVSRDPKDDIFIACAVDGKANYIVSEDKDLLAVGEHQGIQIINVPTFFEILKPKEDTPES